MQREGKLNSVVGQPVVDSNDLIVMMRVATLSIVGSTRGVMAAFAKLPQALGVFLLEGGSLLQKRGKLLMPVQSVGNVPIHDILTLADATLCFSRVRSVLTPICQMSAAGREQNTGRCTSDWSKFATIAEPSFPVLWPAGCGGLPDSGSPAITLFDGYPLTGCGITIDERSRDPRLSMVFHAPLMILKDFIKEIEAGDYCCR